MSANRRRYFGVQFELPALSVGKVDIAAAEDGRAPLNEWDIIGELRARLRRAQAAQFRAEANLAIVTEERNKLADKLQRIVEALKR